MGGADDAGRHAAQFLRGDPCLLAHGAGVVPGDFAENAPECAQAAPTGPEGDFRDREFAVAQQGGCAFDAPGKQIAMWRSAECFFEGAGEMRLGYVAHACQPLNGPVFVRSGVHPILCTKQAAQ